MHLPANAALLIVDVQRGFDDPAWGERNNPGAEANIARLLAAWRSGGRPVHHVHHVSLHADGSFRHGSAGHLPKPEAEPRAGEMVHRKTVNSAFIGTALEETLTSAGIRTLVIVGFTTNHCVSTTARMAGNLGFDTYVVADATAAFQRRALDGTIRPAQTVHDGALSDIQGEFAAIVDTQAVLAAGVTPMPE